MFEQISKKIDKAFHLLKGQGKITEVNISEALKEVRKALLEADVQYKIAKDFVSRVKDKAIGQGILKHVSPRQMLIKIAHDELVALMGHASAELKLDQNPNVILLVGMQGAGKTTHAAKLANYIKKKGRSVLLVACDVYRAAAIEQLRTLAEKNNLDFFSQDGEQNVLSIAKAALQHAKANHHNVLIFDTAGRMAIDEAMMQEVENLKNLLNPQEILFVADAMIGQDAVNLAKAFNDRLAISGVILSKMDGDTRAGAALSIKTVVEKPIKFIGTGEKIEALEVFHPDRIADRMLGMGDIVSFVEKAQEAFDADKFKQLNQKVAKNQLDFEDFLAQIEQIEQMGSVKDVLGMVPGMSNIAQNLPQDHNPFGKVRAIIQSMTPKERKNPALMAQPSRKQRVAKGSASSIEEVNRILKQREQLASMLKMTQGKPGAMARIFDAMKGRSKF
jgi:signal recognition particle subunit SRP54